MGYLTEVAKSLIAFYIINECFLCALEIKATIFLDKQREQETSTESCLSTTCHEGKVNFQPKGKCGARDSSHHTSQVVTCCPWFPVHPCVLPHFNVIHSQINEIKTLVRRHSAVLLEPETAEEGVSECNRSARRPQSDQK